MKKSNVESFDLDHTKVVAPYIRLASEVAGQHGDKIYKYDVRFKQPNMEHMEMPGLHSLEHLMAHYIRDHLKGVVDISPMGCQTGFYAIVLNNSSWDDFANAFAKTLENVLDAKEVPAANIYQCGWGDNHDLEGAKKIAREMVKSREKWKEIFS
jgi:S-ribosylhomocysteine lyase